MKEDLYINYVKLLKNEYKDIFERIDIYIASHGLIVDNTSEIMEDVLDLLLTAQENQTPIEKIIGNDFEKFCDQVIESHKESIIERFLSYFQWFRYMALIFGILELFALIFDYLDGVKNPWNISIDVGDICFCIGIPFFFAYLFNMIRKKLVMKKWYTQIIDTILIILLIVISIVSCYILSDYVLSFISIPRFIFIPFTFIFFIFMTKRKKKQKQKENHIPFDIIVYNEMIKTYRKQYEKYVKKCQDNDKKYEDVKEWYEKKYKKDLLYQKISDIALILILLVFIIIVASSSETFDTIIFIIIITCVEVPIFQFSHKGNQMRINIHKELERKNTNIYDDELLKEE